MTEHVAEDDPQRIVQTAKGGEVTVGQLWDRVTMVEPNILSMQDLDGGTPETLTILTDRILDLAAELPRFGVVIDLTKIGAPPTGDYRKFIPGHWEQVHADAGGRLVLVAVAVSGSPVARVIGKFLIGRMIRIPMELVKSLDAAVGAIRKALAKSG
jgi:hypothetical protein